MKRIYLTRVFRFRIWIQLGLLNRIQIQNPTTDQEGMEFHDLNITNFDLKILPFLNHVKC
jgi:hypothetical protein